MLPPESSDRAYYHCISRVVNRDFLLGEAEKDHFVKLMRCYERFCGLRVLTYCIMSNHFHILVEVPRRPVDEFVPDDASLVALVRSTLGKEQAEELRAELKELRESGAVEGAEELRERWLGRMWALSPFIKVLKQRFTQWFNGRHERRGTLWETSFRSVLVEGEPLALNTMAAYIDLNPVRAAICEDPQHYRWSGYGAAVEGGKANKAAREALVRLTGIGPQGERREVPKKEALARWRCELAGVPYSKSVAKKLSEGENVGQQRLPRDKALKVLASGGRLSRPDYLRCRVRYFTDGAAIGTRDFVEQVFRANRGSFSERRKTGARALRGLKLSRMPERLYALRQLQKRLFG